MAIHPKPTLFDGAKFSRRYNLEDGSGSRPADFWDDGQGNIVTRSGVVIPDDPPIFEPPDSPTEGEKRDTARRAVSNRPDASIITVKDLKDMGFIEVDTVKAPGSNKR